MKKKFSRVRSAKDMIFSGITLAAGLILILLGKDASTDILGFLILTVGVLCIFVMKSNWKDTGDGKIYKKHIAEFPLSQKKAIMDALAAGEVDRLPEAGGQAKGGIMMEVFVGADATLVHLYEFVAYNYESCSDYYVLGKEAAGIIITKAWK